MVLGASIFFVASGTPNFLQSWIKKISKFLLQVIESGGPWLRSYPSNE